MASRHNKPGAASGTRDHRLNTTGTLNRSNSAMQIANIKGKRGHGTDIQIVTKAIADTGATDHLLKDRPSLQFCRKSHIKSGGVRTREYDFKSFIKRYVSGSTLGRLHNTIGIYMEGSGHKLSMWYHVALGYSAKITSGNDHTKRSEVQILRQTATHLSIFCQHGHTPRCLRGYDEMLCGRTSNVR